MVLVDVLGGLLDLVRIRRGPDVDSSVFKLHYRVTSTILLSFCILVTTTGLVGTPINCIHGNKIPDSVINTYCWIHTTFTLPKYFHRGKNKVVYPGVGPSTTEDDKIYHSYYQWVPFVFFIQGIIFYIPHWLWRIWEGRKLRSLTDGLATPVMSRECRREKIALLVDYLVISMHSHNIYALGFLFCESLNFINSLFNMWFINAFLGGVFYKFGPEVIQFTQMDQEDRTDPLVIVFPRVTKCTFYKFGASGTMETNDVMCVLALNNINEKLFIFLWFWFVILSVISGLAFLYRILVVCIPFFRVAILQKKIKFRKKSHPEILVEKLQFGDCFLLYLLSKNIEIVLFTAIVEKLCYYLESRRHVSQPDIELSIHGSNSPEQYHLVGDERIT